jgi:hypothetical protein
LQANDAVVGVGGKVASVGEIGDDRRQWVFGRRVDDVNAFDAKTEPSCVEESSPISNTWP